MNKARFCDTRPSREGEDLLTDCQPTAQPNTTSADTKKQVHKLKKELRQIKRDALDAQIKATSLKMKAQEAESELASILKQRETVNTPLPQADNNNSNSNTSSTPSEPSGNARDRCLQLVEKRLKATLPNLPARVLTPGTSSQIEASVDARCSVGDSDDSELDSLANIFDRQARRNQKILNLLQEKRQELAKGRL